MWVAVFKKFSQDHPYVGAVAGTFGPTPPQSPASQVLVF